MKTPVIVTAAVVAGVASAAKCKDLKVPIQVSARNGVFDVKATQNNIEVTEFVLNLARQGHNYTQEVLKGYATVGGKYEIAATYCVPKPGKSKKAPAAVQLLTHGILFDRSYWNSPYNNGNYSYTAVAADQYGYATFSWDRLGTGMSSHGEPVNEIQALLEVDALRALTEGLRAGSIQGVPKFRKVVHVGHSFGSTHTYALTAQHPHISDGIVLTGFSQNGTFMPTFVLGGNFVDVKTDRTAAPLYDHGYLTAGDASAVQTSFFAPNGFDPNVVDFVTKSRKPVTIGELLTIGGETASPNKFKGPVLIITGERDVPFCDGDCNAGAPAGSNIPAQSQKNFPNTKIKTIIVPGSGHGLNFEYSHPFTYGCINDFFKQSLGA